MNSSRRARGLAFAAQTTFIEVYVREVILYGNGLEVALFLAFSAADTAVQTGFACYSAFVFVAAQNDDSAVLRALLTQLNQLSRAGFDALTASGTFVLVHFG